MPVAAVIGADPATLLASVMPAPKGVSELAWSGMISDRRVRMAPCREIMLNVPTSTEIVLEGTVSPLDKALEDGEAMPRGGCACYDEIGGVCSPRALKSARRAVPATVARLDGGGPFCPHRSRAWLGKGRQITRPHRACR